MFLFPIFSEFWHSVRDGKLKLQQSCAPEILFDAFISFSLPLSLSFARHFVSSFLFCSINLLISHSCSYCVLLFAFLLFFPLQFLENVVIPSLLSILLLHSFVFFFFFCYYTRVLLFFSTATVLIRCVFVNWQTEIISGKCNNSDKQCNAESI